MGEDNTNNLRIKKLKPKKGGFYKQGTIDPRKCKKYYTSCMHEPIIYRSGLELQFINFCEQNQKISKWASEPIKIPYYSRLNKKEANYYPDYIIENDNGTKCIVEIKPSNQVEKPSMVDSLWLKENWIRNNDKWVAAKKFAEEHNMKFIIITEKFFE
jgi:hypothetical protein